MNTGEIGAACELSACTWLLTQGYVVFRNVSPVGFADIVVFKDGKTTYIDVKGSKLKKRCKHYGSYLNDYQLELGVKKVIVDSETLVCLGFEEEYRESTRKSCLYCGGLLKHYNQSKYCSKRCYNEATSIQTPKEKFAKIIKPKKVRPLHLIRCLDCGLELTGKQRFFCESCSKVSKNKKRGAKKNKHYSHIFKADVPFVLTH